ELIGTAVFLPTSSIGGATNAGNRTGAASVQVFGARSVDMRDIYVSAGTGALNLISGSQGAIAIRGQLVSDRPIVIGAADNTAAIDLANNITTTNQDVTFNGNVTLFDGIDRWAVERASLGIAPLASDPYVDGRLFVSTYTSSDPNTAQSLLSVI